MRRSLGSRTTTANLLARIWLGGACWLACQLNATSDHAGPSSEAGPTRGSDSGLAGSKESADIPSFRPQPVPDPRDFGAPSAGDGTIVMVQTDLLELRFDPNRAPNPMTTRLTCSDWLMQCFESTGRNMDACFAVVPQCQTDSPWTEPTVCCPSDCLSDYSDARTGGSDPIAAWLAVFSDEVTCVPHYAEWVNGGAQ